MVRIFSLKHSRLVYRAALADAAEGFTQLELGYAMRNVLTLFRGQFSTLVKLALRVKLLQAHFLSCRLHLAYGD